MQPGDRIQRLGILRQAVGLAIVDHLQPVLDRAEEAIGGSKIGALVRPDPAGASERRQSVER